MKQQAPGSLRRVSALDDDDDDDDRRRAIRKKIKLKKIFAAEVHLDGGTQNCFVHIHDLSEVGMRVHADVRFPEGQEVPLNLFLDGPISLRVQVVWSKELIGGMYVAGLDFPNILEEERRKISEFLDRHSRSNKRTRLRLQRILVVEMILGSTRQKFGVFTLDISTTGMKIVHEFPLPEDIQIPFRILLEYDKDPIEVTAQSTWQEENQFGQFMIGLEFVDITSEAQSRIEDFMEAQVRGELGEGQAFATLSDDFSSW